MLALLLMKVCLSFVCLVANKLGFSGSINLGSFLVKLWFLHRQARQCLVEFHSIFSSPEDELTRKTQSSLCICSQIGVFLFVHICEAKEGIYNTPGFVDQICNSSVDVTICDLFNPIALRTAKTP